MTKIILKKIITKNKTQKKNWKKTQVGKHYSNSHCYVRKATVLTPHNLALLAGAELELFVRGAIINIIKYNIYFTLLYMSCKKTCII